MLLSVDTRTVVSLMVVACFLMGGGLLAVSRLYHREVPEASRWAWATLLQGVGWLIFGTLRGTLPEAFSIVVGQLLIQCSVALYLVVVHQSVGVPFRASWLVALLAANAVALIVYSVIAPSYENRQVVIAATRGFFAFRSAQLLFQASPRPRSYTFTAGLFSLSAGILAARAVLYLAFRDLTSAAPLEAHPLTALSYLGYFVIAVALPFGFVLMSSERYLDQRARAENELRRAASVDQLTQLANRAAVTEQLRKVAARHGRGEGDVFGVLFVDLDNFKFVNDSLGHEAGDRLLVETATRLKTALRGDDVVGTHRTSLAGRFGGDEFVLVLDGLRGENDAALVAERLLDTMLRPFELNGQTVNVRCSIGVSTSARGFDALEDLLRDADTALYQAKAAGKATYVVFDESMRRDADTRLALERELRQAIASQDVYPVYQPVLDLATGKLRGFDALPEWRHGERGIVPREEYLHLAEETGLSVMLGERLLEEVAAALVRMPEGSGTDLRVSIGVTRRQLVSAKFRATAQRLASHPAVHGRLSFAVSETAVAGNTAPVRSAFADIRAVAAEIYLDDFGAGPASLTLVRTLPIDGLKVSAGFAAAAHGDRQTLNVLNSLIVLGHTLGKAVTIGGVTDRPMLATLLALECDAVQGPILGEARSSEELHALLTADYSALCAAA